MLAERDECNRPSTKLEHLAALKPVWKDGKWGEQGEFITAGAASQFSYGGAVSLLVSRAEAKRHGLQSLSIAKAGCAPDEMGIGPVVAMPKLLKRFGLRVADIEVWETNESFACQVLHCRDVLGSPLDRLNIKGGAIAIGLPFGMSAARMVGHSLLAGHWRGARYVVVLMRIGEGMGAAGLFEFC